jgi:excisionase family DNA binding protein
MSGTLYDGSTNTGCCLARRDSVQEGRLMARPKNAKKPAVRTKLSTGTQAAPDREARWPEVLTLAEAAAYLRVPEAEVARMVGPRGLPGRLIGSEWRFSRTAVNPWLQTPPVRSTKEFLLALTGVGKGDPDAERGSRRSTASVGGP